MNFYQMSGNEMIMMQCVYPKYHRGPCADDNGNSWVRVKEHLRLAREQDQQ